MSYVIIRAIHTWVVAVLVGGVAVMAVITLASRIVWREDWNRFVLQITRAVEWVFWPSLGIVVFTGAGNLGAFGEGLPDHTTPWGHRFLVKVGCVAALFVVSFLRLIAVTSVQAVPSQETGRVPRHLVVWYCATALILSVVFVIAVRLAHG
jgi:hypothetical protein